MATNNTVQLSGFIGRDVEERGRVASTSIAVRQSWRDAEGAWQERTHWVPLVGFGPQSPLRGLAKGAHVRVSGRLQSSQFTDAQGVQRTSLEVVVLVVEPLGARYTPPAEAADEAEVAEVAEAADAAEVAEATPEAPAEAPAPEAPTEAAPEQPVAPKPRRRARRSKAEALGAEAPAEDLPF